MGRLRGASPAAAAAGGGDGFGGGGDGNVQEMNRRNFEDPEFVEQLERCLHWRPKALKGYDMKAVKEEARVTINMLKQCLQQSLVRKENMVEDLMRAERDRDQGMEGVKLQMESANASAQAAERELAATRTQMGSARARGKRELGRSSRREGGGGVGAEAPPRILRFRSSPPGG